jgi:ethanolamine utilization protein EutN
MDIFQVVGPLVCTYRHEGLGTLPLRVLRDRKGKLQVAVDTVGSRKGNWVFTISGSAARMALDDKTLLSDLTIGGIIDYLKQEDKATNPPRG